MGNHGKKMIMGYIYIYRYQWWDVLRFGQNERNVVFRGRLPKPAELQISGNKEGSPRIKVFHFSASFPGWEHHTFLGYLVDRTQVAISVGKSKYFWPVASSEISPTTGWDWGPFADAECSGTKAGSMGGRVGGVMFQRSSPVALGHLGWQVMRQVWSFNLWVGIWKLQQWQYMSDVGRWWPLELLLLFTVESKGLRCFDCLNTDLFHETLCLPEWFLLFMLINAIS